MIKYKNQNIYKNLDSRNTLYASAELSEEINKKSSSASKSK